MIERVLAPLSEGWDGVVPRPPDRGHRQARRGRAVVETVDRHDLVGVQTPQAFLAPTLRAAYAGELGGATDCASLVEARGGRVRWVEGDRGCSR